MAAAKRTASETWDAIERQAREAEIKAFLALTPAQVDARLRARGEDPAAVRAEGEALVRRIRAQLDRSRP
jgi:hypothetical protein